MNYFEELGRINDDILSFKGSVEYLLSNVDELTQETKNYLQQSYEYNGFDLSENSSTAISLKIRRDALGLQDKVNRLKIQREEIISKIINCTSISISDIIRLLNEFGLYYKTERFGTKTLIVPQSLYIIKTGSQSVMDEEDFLRILRKVRAFKERNGQLIPTEVVQSVPLYINSTIYGKVLNNHITEVASGIEVSDLEGIKLYVRTESGVSFNKKLLNIFPYDVLAFIDYFVMKRFDNPTFDIIEAYKEYTNGKSFVGGLSYDDPIMIDTHRYR